MKRYAVTIRKTFTIDVVASNANEAKELALETGLESWKEVVDGTFVSLIETNEPAEIYRAFAEDALA